VNSNWFIEGEMYSAIIKSRLAQRKLNNCFAKTCKIGLLSKIQASKIGEHALVASFVTLCKSNLGDYSYVNKGCFIDETEIGRFTAIAPFAAIGCPEHNLCVTVHPFYMKRLFGRFVAVDSCYDNQKETLIGNDCWIGTHAVVMKGVVVSDGAVIGAGSVVTKNVPPYAIVVGNPARIIRYRFETKTIDKLQRTKWWCFDRKTLERMVAQKALKDMAAFEEFLASRTDEKE
jgi:acetyltransferase-like isoleucine patch superfamily enzyme